jgi:hypothetical protein
VKVHYEACTILMLGMVGRLDGDPFELVARTCVRGRKGALWNEWVMRFTSSSSTTKSGETGERLKFLAESGNALTIYEEQSILPSIDMLAIGAPIDTGFVVVERGRATRVAHWGVVDGDASPSYAYADLSSRTGVNATIDYGSDETDRPRVFFGRRVTLTELALRPHVEHPRFIPVPELSRPKGVEPWLDVGDEGELAGTRFRVMGIVSRSLLVEPGEGDGEEEDGDAVTWDEYLLHNAHVGFRWLVIAEGHWSLVESVDAGVIGEDVGSATISGETHEKLSEGIARVDWAAGELPWEIAIGDTSNVRDFVSPPWMLSKEWSDDDVSWSRGIYVEPDTVAKAFGKRALPKPEGRAPNQPPSLALPTSKTT